MGIPSSLFAHAPCPLNDWGVRTLLDFARHEGGFEHTGDPLNLEPSSHFVASLQASLDSPRSIRAESHGAHAGGLYRGAGHAYRSAGARTRFGIAL